jgi:hypothetical protein
MPLSEDSRSLLQLLLVRRKSYGDIAGLLGVDESEVRRRAHDALEDLAGTDPDAKVDLTGYLLGQADPIDRAETARALADDPDLKETAAEILDQLRLLAPGAELPDLGSTAGGVTARRPSRPAPRSDESRKTPRPAPLSGLSATQKRLFGTLVAAALLVVIVVVVIGAFGGDGNGEEELPEPAPTTAVLNPVEGQAGRGQVSLGQGTNGLAAQLQFNRLRPTAEGQSYVLWLNGPAGVFPIHQAEVNESRAIAGQIDVPLEVLCPIAQDLFTGMRLSLAGDTEFNRALQQARQGGNPQGGLVDFVGTPTLEGRIAMPQETKDLLSEDCSALAEAAQLPEG